MNKNKSNSRYHLIVKLVLSIMIMSFINVTNTFAAQSDYSPSADSIKLYKHDLKYVGSSTIIDPNYRYVMEELIEILTKNPKTTIHIRGHVCCGPSERISFKRARHVFKYLVQHGISRQRISFKGYSDKIPLAYPEKTEEDEFMNRRVDFIISHNESFPSK